MPEPTPVGHVPNKPRSPCQTLPDLARPPPRPSTTPFSEPRDHGGGHAPHQTPTRPHQTSATPYQTPRPRPDLQTRPLPHLQARSRPAYRTRLYQTLGDRSHPSFLGFRLVAASSSSSTRVSSASPHHPCTAPGARTRTPHRRSPEHPTRDKNTNNTKNTKRTTVNCHTQTHNSQYAAITRVAKLCCW